MTRLAAHPRPQRTESVLGDQAARLRAIVEAAERKTSTADALAAAGRSLHVRPAPGRRARVVTISSGKGGVGKTCTCVNLAVALAGSGRRTTLLDADLGMANADVLCGLSPARRLEHYLGVSDLVPGGRPRSPHEAVALAQRRLTELAVEAPGGFRLIPGSVGVARMAELNPREQARLMAGLIELESEADVVLVDTGAGLGPEIVAFMHEADLALVVATPEPTSMADAYALIKCAVGHDAAVHNSRSPEGRRQLQVGLVVNQAASNAEAQAVHARIAAVCAKFLNIDLPLLGWIAQDPRVAAAVRVRRPLLLDAEDSEAARDLRRLAQALEQRLGLNPRPKPPAAPRSGISGLLARCLLRGG